MPQRPNRALRVAVPIILLLVAIGIALAVVLGPGGARQRAAERAAEERQTELAADTPASDAAADETGEAAAETPAASDTPADSGDLGETAAAALEVAAGETPATEITTPTTAPTTGLRARRFTGDPAASSFAPLGELSDDSPYLAELEFSPYGAGIASLKLTHDYRTVEKKEHVELQSLRTANGVVAVPFSVLQLNINGEVVNLSGFDLDTGADAPMWRSMTQDGQRVPGAFEAIIENTAGEAVLRIERRFVFEPGRYDLKIEQKLVNLTGKPLNVRVVQTGPIELPEPHTRYGGDKRRFRYGYMTPAQAERRTPYVTPDNKLTNRQELLGSRTEINGTRVYDQTLAVYPTERTAAEGEKLVWLALTDRYFAVAAHPRLRKDPADLTYNDKTFELASNVDRLVLDSIAGSPIVLRLTSDAIAVPANGSADASMGIYAGPLSKETIEAEPVAESLNLTGLIVYNFGGWCAPCTFSWLTGVLLWVLETAHSIVGDWALSIILLVLVVRTALHPITRWSQIRMQRFGKQMQAMGPKQQKLKEKYKDDPKKLQEETAKLWREEGINPAGMLGCLPMFLQSPVWIALYATLFFAYELRHQPAFYGVFQSISGGEWMFLADLASPDAAIPLPTSWWFTPPLLGNIYGEVRSINLLPILLGFVFFVHQKFLTPPTSATMTPEQESQQKLIRVLSVGMFPIFMYVAPSGLAIYFITNSTLAIFENKWIRAHCEKHGLLDVDKMKAERAAKKAKGGFIQRLQEAAERQRQLQMQAKGQGAGPGTGKRGRVQSRPSKKVVNRKYKKRGE